METLTDFSALRQATTPADEDPQGGLSPQHNLRGLAAYGSNGHFTLDHSSGHTQVNMDPHGYDTNVEELAGYFAEAVAGSPGEHSHASASPVFLSLDAEGHNRQGSVLSAAGSPTAEQMLGGNATDITSQAFASAFFDTSSSGSSMEDCYGYSTDNSLHTSPQHLQQHFSHSQHQAPNQHFQQCAQQQTGMPHANFAPYQYQFNNSDSNPFSVTRSGRTPAARPFTSSGKPKRKRVINTSQRTAANVRERRRMTTLNDAFEGLRDKVPTFSYEKKISRIETLKLALMYIDFMKNMIDGKNVDFENAVQMAAHGNDRFQL